MERMWLGAASKQFKDNWIVAINVTWGEKCMVYGDIYMITPSKDEAYAMAILLKKAGQSGKVTVMQGENHTPQVGGLELWSQ